MQNFVITQKNTLVYLVEAVVETVVINNGHGNDQH